MTTAPEAETDADAALRRARINHWLEVLKASTRHQRELLTPERVQALLGPVTGSEATIDAMVQKEPGEGEQRVDIVMLTHRALEKNVVAAMARIEKLPTVLGKVTRIRLEELL